MDDIDLDEITITLVRERKSEKLFRWFENNGYQVEETFKGIYYVSKEGYFLTQVIVSKQLSRENQKWLTLLSGDLDRTDVARVVSQIKTLTEENEKRHGDSVLQVAMQENEEVFNEIKEDENMCEALRKFFEPELNEAIEKAIKSVEESSQKEIILNALKAGNSVADISKVMLIPEKEIEAVVEANC